jgi:hypothetical protein
MSQNEHNAITWSTKRNRVGTKCVIYEAYANSESVFVYINGVASQTVLPKIFNVYRISRFEVTETQAKSYKRC